MFRSPAKTSASASSASTRWSKQEKELFEEGLVSFFCEHAGVFDVDNEALGSAKIQDGCVVFFCRLSLVEGGLKLPNWWEAVLFFRSRAMPDNISNRR